MEIKAAVCIVNITVAVDNGCGDETGVVGEETSDGDSFSEEVDVAVSGAGVCSGEDEDIIAVAGVVDSGLDVIEIVRPLLVDDDNFCCAGNS